MTVAAAVEDTIFRRAKRKRLRDHNYCNMTYQCCDCAVSDVKLWRALFHRTSRGKLRCCDCAAKNQHHLDIHDMAETGMHMNMNKTGMTDQIGCLVPAIPMKESDAFSGDIQAYPEEDWAWWDRLPLRR